MTILWPYKKPGLFVLVLLIPALCFSAFSFGNTPAAVNGSDSPNYSDNDGDGFPDRAELISENDRTVFRRWFAAISQSQFYFYHDQWPEIRRDCAGLICFAYKEALKKHDKAWLKSFKYLTNPAIPDVSAFSYPDVPVLGTALFHTGNGHFEPVATARVLMEHNCTYIGHTLNDDIKQGDLLFFRYFKEEKMLFHAMIVIGKTKNRGQNENDAIVAYHTGGDYSNKGEVRILSISSLNKHPDDIWHVKPHNKNFMGFYRFHILNYKIDNN